MKIAVSNIAWDTERDTEMLGFLSENGVTGLEIAPTRIISKEPYKHLNAFDDYKSCVNNQYHMSIVSLQSVLFGRRENIFGSSKERNDLIVSLENVFDLAARLKCKNVVFGCPKNRIKKHAADDETAIRFFSLVGNVAKKYDVILAIEPNPAIYGTNFLNTTEEVVKFVRRLNLGNVRINYDMGTAIYNSEPLSILRDNISLINHIHISEPWLERPIIEDKHKRMAKTLRDLQYKNYVSLEMKEQANTELAKKTIKKFISVFNG